MSLLSDALNLCACAAAFVFLFLRPLSFKTGLRPVLASIIILTAFMRLAGPRALGGYADPVSAILWLAFLYILFKPGPAREITKREGELQEALDKKTAELEKTTREMDYLGYLITHDLRAPLRAIDGFTAALLEDCSQKLDREGRENLEKVRGSTYRMSATIDGLAVFFKVTRAEITSEPVDLSAIAEKIIEELKKSRPGRKVEFFAEKGLTVTGDRDMLRLALENLLGNSWKFTGKHASARIEFGSGEKNGRKTYFIRDDGAGFDAGYKTRLFTPFQRLHSTREFEGAGLGLAIVRRIIERHNGMIWAEAEPEKGATFYFTLGDCPSNTRPVS